MKDIFDKKRQIESLVDKKNIAEELSEEELTKIADIVFTRYISDDSSRNQDTTEGAFDSEIDKITDLVMQKCVRSKKPFIDAAQANYPLITNAAVSFYSEAYPALINDGNIVKSKVIGDDEGVVVAQDEQTGEPIYSTPPQHKLKRGQRVAEYMNWDIMENEKGWVPLFCRSLISSSVQADAYRKILYSEELQRIETTLVLTKDLIVNNNTSVDLGNTIITQKFELYPNQIQSKINNEEWIEYREDNAFTPDGLDKNKDYGSYSFIEQHTFLDFDDDKYAEPYIVTMHEGSRKVVRIQARYREKGINRSYDGDVTYIKPIDCFVRYSFLPSLNGKFLSTGLGSLLKSSNKGINKSLNLLLDAGQLSNQSSGFISSDMKLKGGNIELGMGQYKYIGTSTASIHPIIHKEPSQTLYNLLMSMIEIGKETANTPNALSEMSSNTSPTTLMIFVEQGVKAFKSIFKGLQESLKNELKLRYDLISEHYGDKGEDDETSYSNILDNPEANFEEDFNPDSRSITPVADPTIVTNIEKYVRSNYLMELVQNPAFAQHMNVRKVLENCLEVTGIEVEDYMIKEEELQPQENPMLVLQEQQLELERMKIEINLQKEQRLAQEGKLGLIKEKAVVEEVESKTTLNYAKAEEAIANAESKEAGSDLDRYNAHLGALKQISTNNNEL